VSFFSKKVIILSLNIQIAYKFASIISEKHGMKLVNFDNLTGEILTSPNYADYSKKVELLIKSVEKNTICIVEPQILFQFCNSNVLKDFIIIYLNVEKELFFSYMSKKHDIFLEPFVFDELNQYYSQKSNIITDIKDFSDNTIKKVDKIVMELN